MLKVIAEQDLIILRQFSKSFTADCATYPELRFSDPMYTVYNVEFLHRLQNSTHYTPLPPTQDMLTKAAHVNDWIVIFKHCNLMNFTVEDLCRMSALPTDSVAATISQYQPLTSDFIHANYAWISWEMVSVNERIGVHVMLENQAVIDWVAVSRQDRSIDELLRIEHLVDWEVVVDSRSMFDLQFVRTFQWTINFSKLSTKILSAETIVEFADYLDMDLVSQNIPVDSLHFIDGVKDVINWKVFIDSHETFSPEFVDAFYRYIDFEILSEKYLDVETLDGFANVLNWTKIHRNRRYTLRIKKQFASRMWWDKLLQL